jgi:hypothetical protein
MHVCWSASQRFADAIAQLEAVTASKPQLAPPSVDTGCAAP